jgi:hypothetical protein
MVYISNIFSIMRYVPVFLFLLFPLTSNAALMFSEIAWMGTDADANNEWIEMYNFGTEPADLTGWTITGGGGLSITLSGTLGPHGVGLLERTDDTTVPSVDALLIYTGALPNTGDSDALTLTLRDPSGTVVDQVVGGTDWSLIGGSNAVPKKTAQRTRMNTWVTAAPTPGDQNAQESDEEEEQDDNGTTTDDTSTSTDPNTVKKSSSSKKTTTKLIIPDAELTITLNHPEVVYAGRSVAFSVTPSGIGSSIMNSLVYTWNFGDTYTGAGKSVTHTYEHPGTYLLVLEAVYRSRSVVLEYPVRVLPMTLTLERAASGDITVTNKTESTIDVSGYTLEGSVSFVFPKLSRISAGGSLVIDKARIGGSTGVASLTDLRGALIAQVGMSHTVAPTNGGPLVAMTTVPSAKSVASTQPVLKTDIEPKSTSVSGTEPVGTVMGTSTGTGAFTIPVYAAESGENSLTRGSHSYLPYAGLIAIVVVGIVLLYRRPQTHEDQ